MLNNDFELLREEMTRERFRMSDRKAVGYTEGSEDRHNNFRLIGRELGLDPLTVLNVYLAKHLHSYWHYCKTGEQSGEGIAQTIMDILNYFDLSHALIEEQCSKRPYDEETPGDVGYAEAERLERIEAKLKEFARAKGGL